MGCCLEVNRERGASFGDAKTLEDPAAVPDALVLFAATTALAVTSRSLSTVKAK
jgi:hypothetical protein